MSYVKQLQMMALGAALSMSPAVFAQQVAQQAAGQPVPQSVQPPSQGSTLLRIEQLQREISVKQLEEALSSKIKPAGGVDAQGAVPANVVDDKFRVISISSGTKGMVASIGKSDIFMMVRAGDKIGDNLYVKSITAEDVYVGKKNSKGKRLDSLHEYDPVLPTIDLQPASRQAAAPSAPAADVAAQLSSAPPPPMPPIPFGM